MPTNTTPPHSSSSIDRLTLDAESVRGTMPSTFWVPGGCMTCFDTETSMAWPGLPACCHCWEAE